MDSPTVEANAGKSEGWPVTLSAALVLVLACWRLAGLLPLSELNQDEFQHVHVAWETLQGRTPYRDFYEHHGPLTAWLGALVLKLRGEAAAGFETFWVFRRLHLGLVFGQFGMVALIVRRLSGSWASGLASSALLAASPFMVWVGLQFHPDGLMNLLVLGALWLLLDRRDAAAAVLVGLLPAVHPKSLAAVVFIGAGVVAEALARRAAGDPGATLRVLGRRLGLMLAAIAAVQAVVFGVFALQGAAVDYGQHAWFENFASAGRASAGAAGIAASSRSKLWVSDPTMVSALGAGLVWALVVAWRERRQSGAGERWLVLGASLASLVCLALPFRAYSLLLPLVLAAAALGVAARTAADGVRWAPLAVGACACLTFWKEWREPVEEFPSTAMHRATLGRVLAESRRDEPVFYVWPSRCAAYTFNADPDYDWLLTTPGLFDVASPEKEATFRRVFDEKVVRGDIRYVAIAGQHVGKLPPDARDYLTRNFTSDGCLWTRRR
ncbi:MAG: hypothetical protein RL199_851 [Pseudomonadota bacterium]|jgi:hypothetical protein